uniref:Ribonuclease H-like domain-containing protein n=1 Tax=Tanacetum cinerariifolium TaxID=118510 RepID=A0A6L2LRV8_TANCI|nr:ribonuclease H-like domain-containing protein [Tanacetum cinerariifolium]
MRGTSAQTRFERVLEQPNEPPLTEGHTSGSGEDRLEENIELTDTIPTPHDSPLSGGCTPGSDEGRITLAELMETYTTLSNRVTQFENELSTTKAVYNKAFITLTNRVTKLESQLKQKRNSKIEREVMKRVGFDLQQGSSKKQRLDQQTEETKEKAKAQGNSDQEVEELKLYMRIIPKEDIAIEAIPLAIKPPMIIEYKIVKEEKISTYHIIRADGSTRRYTLMINLLENIDREDLETLWRLVKDKYANTRFEEGQIICYCKSKPNGKILAKSIIEGPYKSRQILEPGNDTLTPPARDTYKLQTKDKLNETEQKQVEADDQAIHILLLGLPSDVYAVVDSCHGANEMWHCIQRLKKDELGLETGVLLFNYIRILGESLGKVLVTLIGDEDVLTLLKYVFKFREIKVYMEESMSLVEHHMNEVMNGKGKDDAIIIFDDDSLDDASSGTKTKDDVAEDDDNEDDDKDYKVGWYDTM